MPTVTERIATLEAFAQDNSRRIGEIYDSINGGPTCEWDRAIRGRLHAMSASLASADKLLEALQETRKLQQETRSSRVKSWQWSVMAAATVVVAICAVVSAVALLFG